MKRFLNARSRRWGYDGWALKSKKASRPMDWSVCTTREEARELRDEVFNEEPFFTDVQIEIVKVRLIVESLPTPPTEDKNDG